MLPLCQRAYDMLTQIEHYCSGNMEGGGGSFLKISSTWESKGDKAWYLLTIFVEQ